jgi:hypothetical protein
MENGIHKIIELSNLAATLTSATIGSTTAFNILLASRLSDTDKKLADMTIGELIQVITDAQTEFTARATA